jgi:hypothetical protein
LKPLQPSLLGVHKDA